MYIFLIIVLSIFINVILTIDVLELDPLSLDLIKSRNNQAIWFGYSLRFFNLEFDKEAISHGWRSDNFPYRWGVLNYKVILLF